MADFQLDIENLIANPNYKVVIAFGGSNIIQGFIQGDLKFGGGNQYNNPFESQAQQKLSDLMAKVQPAATAAANKFLGTNLSSAQISIKSFDQTISSWTGSEKPKFSMTLVFIAINPDDDVTQPIRKMMKAVFPTRAAEGLLMRAPLGYGPALVNNNGLPGMAVGGTIVVKVGKWFRAFGQICTKASPTISKQVIASGRPLWSSFDFEFEPYRAISYSEFTGYFISQGTHPSSTP
jgi:hypothetical protein